MKSPFDSLHDAFAAADGKVALTPQGSGGYDLHHDNLTPKRIGAKPQSVAQHAASAKAGKVSAQKRHAAAAPVIKTSLL